MKISVITVSYNSAATIGDTLASVRGQDYPSVEHIVVDGASKDETLRVAAQYPHVYQILSEPDRGIYDAMNKGLRLATGSIVGFLNSDDFYTHPGVLSNIATAMNLSGADTCYADLQYVRRTNHAQVVRTWKSGLYAQDKFYWGWMPPHPTFFVRREAYEKFGGFDTSLRSAADYELMLRFLLKQGLTTCYLPEIIVRMRSGGLSNASLYNRLLANREDRQAWRLNNIKPRFYTLYLKPASKIMQFLSR